MNRPPSPIALPGSLLIGYTGQHCGQPCLSKEVLNTGFWDFGFYYGLYYGQHGEIVGHFGQSDHAVLEFAMRKWRHTVGQAGIDLMDGGPDISFFFFFFPFFFNRRSLGFLDCFTGQSPGIGRNELAISIPARSCHELGQLMDSYIWSR